MNINKAAWLDSTITAETIQGGGKSMVDMIHNFSMKVFKTLTPPRQWTTTKDRRPLTYGQLQGNNIDVHCGEGIQ